MSPVNFLLLIILAALWGASFLFMRVAVPTLGPVWLIEWRVLLGATLCLMPLLFFVPFTPTAALEAPNATHIVVSVVMLGLLCTGLAYLIYFHLITALGAPSALTVTFLIPVFGILWGHVFLGEAVGWHTFVGGLIVLTGTALVTGFDPRVPMARKPR